MRENIVIIVSGGSGVRMNADVPKQYMEVAGQTILGHCVGRFAGNARIGAIVVVAHPDYCGLAASIAEAAAEGKPVRIAEGGKQRYDSVYAGLKAARMIATDCNVLVHDAVRPNVDKGVIDGVIDALEEYEAACPVVAVADTVLQLQDGFQPKPLNRNEIKLVQTPQGFRMEKIWFAYNEFLGQSNFEPTDDASIYLRYAFNADMAITQGNPDNFKITWPGDVGRFEQLFRRGM
ncbi:MAG TPA: 2-C-methyl-D-erythritol 4-phosphate cytidylyltransferase [Bacteroidales bacterium]|nr:2-C-methyl-D-erythritol 4-phosphate cytidylyltransferase [Bacteroidales bacterium]HOE05775.1 2-C-methyl-D-erythritol 4-phosphate cytidylyltransferase [Bacteroidales bacterium]HQL69573.1 2-C-methyl-D-erythritol 4-phosphate cytidylyltransferase [Bacteroidales bacterium]